MTFNFPKNEEKILKFWKEKKIFEKSLERTKKRPRFVFYEGPPFANGLPGLHHLLARAFKDIILRYKTMQGFFVERRAGWDTHGLPTEMEAEKKLGIKSKKEIEKIGIRKFIEECQNNVFTYKKEWEDFTERIGFWLDFKVAYITCDKDYIESLWWILKQIWQRELLYEDYKVVPYCPRCGTSLSSHEVAQGYNNITENSVYIKFPLIGEKNTYFLVWTTTPWTLPGNSAVYVDKDTEYLKIEVKKGRAKERYILAKACLKIIDEKYKIIEELEAEKLIGKKYKPPFSYFEGIDPKYYHIDKADFVKTEEGTGLVHSAIMYGEEDFERAREQGLKKNHIIDENGRLKDSVPPFKGMFFKDADPLIIEDLKKRELLYKEEMYEHDYPFCWRCKTPLLYYAKRSWFIKMTGVKKELLKNSEKINWEPDYIKKGRFGEWLQEVRDWNLSRERYWGTPIPIWRCQTRKSQIPSSKFQTNPKSKNPNSKKCNNIKVIGSLRELEKLSGKKVKDLHRPHIDEITFKCDKCRGTMRRVSEVVDCWFDSGSMPFAQWHYPFENKEKIDSGEFFPADFISEAIDQTRGWFYTLLAVSTLLEKGTPYKNVICLGLVLDARGQKMSKSRGNVVKPYEVITKFGADCARFYFYTVNPVGEFKRVDFKDIQNLYRKFSDTLWQSYNFFSTYNDKELSSFKKIELSSLSRNPLDRWVISRLESLNSQVIENLDKYDVVGAARPFIDFVDDLSNWYIRRSRERFKNSEKEAAPTLYYVLLKGAKLFAPFVPFIAEELYQKLGGREESVHLDNFPKPDKKLINKELEEKMDQVREIVTQALAQRAEAGIKVRQPLASLQIPNPKSPPRRQAGQIPNELLELIKEEVNVKKITFGRELKLDTKITKDLEKEGRYRELVRNVNKIRKEMGLTPKDVIIIDSTTDVVDVESFKKEVGAKEFKVKKQVRGKEIKLGKEKHYIKIKK